MQFGFIVLGGALSGCAAAMQSAHSRPLLKPLAGFLLAFALLACGDCDRSGCDAYKGRAHPPISQGVAGAVAYETDVVENDCQTCGVSSATLSGWQTTELITTAEAATTWATTPPTFQIDSGAHYYRALDIGHYLLCLAQQATSPCVSFSVTTDGLTTVNLRLISGLSSLLVFDAGSSVPRETTDFSAPAPG